MVLHLLCGFKLVSEGTVLQLLTPMMLLVWAIVCLLFADDGLRLLQPCCQALDIFDTRQLLQSFF